MLCDFLWMILEFMLPTVGRVNKSPAAPHAIEWALEWLLSYFSELKLLDQTYFSCMSWINVALVGLQSFVFISTKAFVTFDFRVDQLKNRISFLSSVTTRHTFERDSLYDYSLLHWRRIPCYKSGRRFSCLDWSVAVYEFAASLCFWTSDCKFRIHSFFPQRVCPRNTRNEAS